jgi:TonB family protein
VLAAGLAHRNPSYSKAMEVAAQAEMPTLKRRLVILDTIITLAPLLGLLGTITGMIDSFGIMSDTGLGQPHAVTGGVGEVLIEKSAGFRELDFSAAEAVKKWLFEPARLGKEPVQVWVLLPVKFEPLRTQRDGSKQLETQLGGKLSHEFLYPC